MSKVVRRSTSAASSEKASPRSSHVRNPRQRPSLTSGTITNEPIPNPRAISSGTSSSPPGSSTNAALPVATASWKALKCAIGRAGERAQLGRRQAVRCERD